MDLQAKFNELAAKIVVPQELIDNADLGSINLVIANKTIGELALPIEFIKEIRTKEVNEWGLFTKLKAAQIIYANMSPIDTNFAAIENIYNLAAYIETELAKCKAEVDRFAQGAKRIQL